MPMLRFIVCITTACFGSDRDSVLAKMFTWVSRRRVTAPLGAARCDDLRRYYAENNKVGWLTYKYRRYVDRTYSHTIHVHRAWNRETSSFEIIMQLILKR